MSLLIWFSREAEEKTVYVLCVPLGVQCDVGIYRNFSKNLYLKNPRQNFMKTYEILSETKGGKLVAVVSTEASSEKDAILQTANFCDMMSIKVHSVRVVK